MTSIFKVCSMALCFLLPTGKQWVHADSGSKGTSFPDVVKVFQTFKDVAAISDSNGDNILECLMVKRTAFDPDARTATYAWTLKPKDGMPRVRPVANENISRDPTPREGAYLYSDYESCVIIELEYYGKRCLLGVQRELKDSVPQYCIDRFAAECGTVVPLYSRDLCYDGEGDY